MEKGRSSLHQKGGDIQRLVNSYYLKNQSEADIAEYMGTPAPVTLTEAPTTAEEHAEEHVEPIEVDEDDLEDMTKVELEELGREHGVELDRRQKKSTLVGKVKNLLS